MNEKNGTQTHVTYYMKSKIEQSLEIISKTQATWSPERISGCKIQNLDRAQGIKLPAALDTPLETHTADVNQRGAQQYSDSDINNWGDVNILTLSRKHL